MGLYSGIAAGVASFPFTWLSVNVFPYGADWSSAILRMVIALLGYVAAYTLFGALVAAAERKPGNAVKGAKAGIAWSGRFFAWMMALSVTAAGLVFLLGYGGSVQTFSTISLVLSIAAPIYILYVYYRTTRRFFLDLKAKGIFWPQIPGSAPPPMAEGAVAADEGKTNGIDPRG